MMDEQTKYKEIIFDNIVDGKVTIKIKIGSTVEELINKYINENYSHSNKNFIFVQNGQEIKRNDKRKVENVLKFNNFNKSLIAVIEK